eukprot:7383090-Prymnesium_polylepis.1
MELNGAALQYASEALRGDREVVEMACEADGWQEGDGQAICWASDAFTANKDLVLAFLGIYGADYFGCASKELVADKEVILVAVAMDGEALSHASDDLKADRDVMLAAVEKSGPGVLQYASEELYQELTAKKQRSE